MTTENEASLRRSARPAKGTGGIEKRQSVYDEVTQHNSRKRKNAPLDGIPSSAANNPMAPKEKSKSKKQKVSFTTDSLVCIDTLL